VESDVDAQLMLKAAAGDKRAFATIFDRYQSSIVRFAFRFVADHAKAEELAQEIFIKLYRSASSYRPSAKLKTYLFRIATNHCLNEVRRHEQRIFRPIISEDAGGEEDREPTAPASDRPDEVVAGKQLESAVQRALEQMSDRERAAFVMCRFEGMPYREIAEVLSATEAAVKSLIHRATLVMARGIESFDAGTIPARRHG
jgi:RNA polymerase sigma-70 factor (ECF subfamily)